MSPKPWWSDGVRFECQETGRCCVSRGTYGFVYLTIEDRRRLARHFGLSTLQFTRRHCLKTDGHFHLRDFTAACPFLEGKRCGVYEARPAQCRTWPFWPETLRERVWKEEVVPFCPGADQGTLHSAAAIDRAARETADAEKAP